MALADFRSVPPAPFVSGGSLGGITFMSLLPMEVQPGAGPFAGENGLGSVPPEALKLMADWRTPALAVVFRLELHDNVRIIVFDAGGTILANRDIHPVAPARWQDEVIIAPGCTRAVLEGGGGDAKLSILLTS